MWIIIYYDTMKNYIDILTDILIENNINPTNEMWDKFEKYYNYLVEYNKDVNLTAITEKEDVYIKHFADCLLGIKTYEENGTLCDIGTGAGFPGIVLKIARPDIKITLVDSLNKRVEFLNKLINLLELKNICALHYRADSEEFKKIYLNSFDYVVARAVANMTTLTEYCLPFVKVGGKFIAYKSDNIDDEIIDSKKCIDTLGGEINTIKHIKLDDNTTRSLVIINKIMRTDKKYPRNQNKPRLNPIK